MKLWSESQWAITFKSWLSAAYLLQPPLFCSKLKASTKSHIICGTSVKTQGLTGACYTQTTAQMSKITFILLMYHQYSVSQRRACTDPVIQAICHPIQALTICNVPSRAEDLKNVLLQEKKFHSKIDLSSLFHCPSITRHLVTCTFARTCHRFT